MSSNYTIKFLDTHFFTHWPSVSPSRGLGFRQRYSRHIINRSTLHTGRLCRRLADSTSVQRDSSGDSCADRRVNLVSGDTIKHIPLITGRVCCRLADPTSGLEQRSNDTITPSHAFLHSLAECVAVSRTLSTTVN